MSKITKKSISRREFLKNTGRIAAASALAAAVVPRIYAAQNNTINVALVGCGGRGSGAAGDALSSKMGPTRSLSE
jgi:Ni,Fe-hydrogenase I small subunit